MVMDEAGRRRGDGREGFTQTDEEAAADGRGGGGGGGAVVETGGGRGR